jgi:hypothetical protein
VLNGYAEEDFPLTFDEHDAAKSLVIRYTGSIYIEDFAILLRCLLRLQCWRADCAGKSAEFDQSVSRDLSCDEQFCKLEPVFADILDEGRVSPRV